MIYRTPYQPSFFILDHRLLLQKAWAYTQVHTCKNILWYMYGLATRPVNSFCTYYHAASCICHPCSGRQVVWMLSLLMCRCCFTFVFSSSHHSTQHWDIPHSHFLQQSMLWTPDHLPVLIILGPKAFCRNVGKTTFWARYFLQRTWCRRLGTATTLYQLIDLT